MFSLIELRRALGMLKADSTDLFNSTELFGNAPCLISKLILKYTLSHIKTDYRSGHPKYPQSNIKCIAKCIRRTLQTKR